MNPHCALVEKRKGIKMKKFLLTMVLLAGLSLPVFADTPDVCGNSYMFISDGTYFLLKFTSADPLLPCSSGTAQLFWDKEKRSYNFTVRSSYFINVPTLGKFVSDEEKLWFISSSTIIFDKY